MGKLGMYLPSFMECATVRERRATLASWTLSTIVFAAVALAACGGDETSAVKVPAAPLTTISTSIALGDASPTSTVKATSTTTAAKASDEVAVRKVHLDFLGMIGVAGDPPNPDHPLVDATTTGVLRTRVRDSLTSRRDLGRRSTGGYKSSIVSVQVRGDSATVLDCSLDESVGFSPTGERGVADTQWYLRSSTVVRTPDGWRVSEFVKGDPCTPAS